VALDAPEVHRRLRGQMKLKGSTWHIIDEILYGSKLTSDRRCSANRTAGQIGNPRLDSRGHTTQNNTCPQIAARLFDLVGTGLRHSASSLGVRRPARKLPVRPNEMASVATWITLQIVLMLRLGFPEGTGLSYLSDHLTGP